MQICVIGGAGYVGLITGLGLAELGHHVISMDLDREHIQALQAGESPIYEEGLPALLQANLEAGRIRFVTDPAEAVGPSEVVFIAVGTPAREDGQADLSQVIQVAEDLTRFIDSYKLIVIKSTVPVGTVELVRSILSRKKRESVDFDIVSNPEFLREGKGLYDFFYPDRIVIGTDSEKARQILQELYGPIRARTAHPPLAECDPRPKDPVPFVETDIASAQMIKYASNAFLAARISFINEIAGLCERVGADIREVARGMGYDPRIGPDYLEAGLGFGGPCLEKDLRALLRIAESNNYEPRLLRAVLDRNDQQLNEMITKVKQLVGYLLYKKIIAVFGLTFKPGTNDVRNSLALRLIEQLEREGAILHAHDPLAIPEARSLLPTLRCFDDPYEAATHAEALVITTDWPQFRELDFERLKREMAKPCIVDGRNLLEPEELRRLGFSYRGVGRP